MNVQNPVEEEGDMEYIRVLSGSHHNTHAHASVHIRVLSGNTTALCISQHTHNALMLYARLRVHVHAMCVYMLVFIRLHAGVSGIELTDNPDVITFETEKSNPRAKLACGHGILHAHCTRQYLHKRALTQNMHVNTLVSCLLCFTHMYVCM